MCAFNSCLPVAAPLLLGSGVEFLVLKQWAAGSILVTLTFRKCLSGSAGHDLDSYNGKSAHGMCVDFIQCEFLVPSTVEGDPVLTGGYLRALKDGSILGAQLWTLLLAVGYMAITVSKSTSRRGSPYC